ncbi:MAG: phosphatase PAP2 family protein [Betaproteobacteria bacterium]|nr:MAG: phosphatase PAP2 family protein [Betaproteobacteria bacterium]
MKAGSFQGAVSPSPLLAPHPTGTRFGRKRGERENRLSLPRGSWELRALLHKLAIGLIGLLVLAPSLLYAQLAPKRLSDWLLEQPASADAYPLGLSWRVPGEVTAQSQLRLDLLHSLSGLDRGVKADSEVLGRLRDWVRTLSVTGRVPVAVSDARWLQANPARDPVLQPGHSAVLPKRPRTVTVVTARGKRCSVVHSAGLEAMAYVQACSPGSAKRTEWAWVAQPDGKVQRFGVAAWNRETQDEPAPGAWIWAPPRDGGFPQHLSHQLIAFLATQGPAPDPQPLASPPRWETEGRDHPKRLGFSPLPSPVSRLPSPVKRDRGSGTEEAGPRKRGRGSGAEEGGSRPSGRMPAPTNPDMVAESRVNAPKAAPGGVSEAWAAGLPELGGAAPGPGDRLRPGGAGVSDADGIAVLPPPTSVPSRSRSLETTASDWGGVGLLQTPSARMEQAGHFTVNFSRIYPYFQGNIMVQPLDWLEAGFRYTSVSNRLYSSDPAFSGDQAYKDKSFDAKFRLLTESAYVPQVALGMRDFGGTGIFSGEYLVASKRTGAFDWSLGLGWGNVGSRGKLRNPLALIRSSFETRRATDTAGNFAFGSYFRGPTALFGGVQYQTPWEPIILKLEYDGNDYQHEGLGNNLRQSSAWNFGAVYRAGRAVDIAFGVERGNTAMLGVTLHTQLDGLSMPKLNDPPRVAVAAGRPQQAPDWSTTSRDIAAQTDWHVRRIEQRGRELRVTLDDAGAVYWRERADRAAAVLHRDAPAIVDRFALTYRQRGVDVAEHVIDRDAWVAQQTQSLAPREQRAAMIARAAETEALQSTLYQDTLPMLETGLAPHYQQTLGGPDGFVLFQAGVAEQVKLRLRDDTWLQGSLQLGLIDNYNKFSNRGSSDLPRVRTYLREYVTTSKLILPYLQATHAGRLGGNQYYSLYGGYLESMFAGVGGEWLYRPFASRLAFGVDANLVQQRNFAQDLGFGNAGTQTRYRVATGHATLYWDTGWNDVQANISAGRYLAKDAGVTVAMSRVFQNGVTVGAFFTKTNVSAEKFGEGSFDKGVYLSVPFDAFLTRSSNSFANVLWKPLTRDGGAKLNRSVQLYGLTSARDDRTLSYKAAPPPNDETIPADRRETWNPPRKGPEPYSRVAPKPAAEQWAADAPGYEQRLVEALYRQQFRNIRVAYDASRRLTVALADPVGARLHANPISRAVGRAVRTALRLGPLDMREIRIVFAQGTDPVVTYNFADLTRLQRYFDGKISAAQLSDSVAVDYLNPSAREQDPLARIDDVDTKAEDSRLADLLALATQPAGRVADDISGAARVAADTTWLRLGMFGTGLVLASSALDRRADQFAKDHSGNRWLKSVNSMGNALPWLALAGSAVAALDGSDPARSRAGYAALEAGGTAFLAVTGLKYAFGRARPGNELGNHAFKPFSTRAGYDSLPSGHTIISWAVATPFAEEYNAPWLYGLAAVTNLARVGSRQHWVSDTVAGSVLGYAIGRVFWESSRAPKRGEPRVLIHPSGINLAWGLN